MKSRIKEWLSDAWFRYTKCYIGVRKGDVFVVKTNRLLACSTGDIAVVKSMYRNDRVILTGSDGDMHLVRLRKEHFKKVRRFSRVQSKAIRDAAKMMKAIMEYGDDLRDIAESLRQQYEATRTIGYLYQAREMEEALRILKEYFPEVLK